MSFKYGIRYIIDLSGLQLNNKTITKMYENIRDYILDRTYI